MASSNIPIASNSPHVAQQNFRTQYDLDNPADAMASYASTMLLHTKRQMEMAQHVARRRTPEPSVATVALQTESSKSSGTSMDSEAS